MEYGEISIEVEMDNITFTVKGIWEPRGPETFYIGQCNSVKGYIEDATYWIGEYCINDIISKEADDRLYQLAMEAME